jgi:hypothetical protein
MVIEGGSRRDSHAGTGGGASAMHVHLNETIAGLYIAVTMNSEKWKNDTNMA